MQSTYKMSHNSRMLMVVAAIIALVAGVALASSYVTKHNIQTVSTQKTKVVKSSAPKTTQTASAPAKNCNDGNVLGAAVGGIGGGVLGSTIGDGTGKTAATIGGTLGGAYLGSQYIPLQNATCP